MNTMKLEVSLPDFDKEISINITLRKDGEVVYSASSPFNSDSDSEQGSSVQVKTEATPTKKTTKRASKVSPDTTGAGVAGNMMNIEI